jgi:hypothetical protein
VQKPWTDQDARSIEAPPAPEETLEASGFRLDGATRVIMEGVAAYIDSATLDRSFRFVARACGRGSTVGFEFFEGVFDNGPADARLRGLGFTGGTRSGSTRCGGATCPASRTRTRPSARWASRPCDA